jgi:hypothetical protein
MQESSNKGFFGVVADPQSYLNILYLLLAFPLGTIYFIFLITGLSVGFGLLITLIGIPILLLVIGGSWALCSFERGLTNALLKEKILSFSEQLTSQGLWNRFKANITDRVTWTGMLYLLLKFPIGIATFTIVVTLISVTLGSLFAPAYAWTSDPLVWGGLEFDPFRWSWIGTLIGIPLIFISLHLMNGTALISGRIARVLLSKK